MRTMEPIDSTNELGGRRRTAAILMLALCVFIIGTAELLPMGLLLPISGDIGVTIPTAGMLVTGYALGVVFGGPVLSILTGRLPRKALMCSLIVLFMVGGGICAVAPTYAILIIGRIISALAHGVLFGIMVVTAKTIAPPGKEGASIAMVGSGLTIAVILGAPLGAFLGQQFGWRLPFLVVTLLSFAALLGIMKLVPSMPSTESAPIKGQLRTVSRPQFILVLLMTVFGAGGTFVAFTYITPILERITLLSEGAISVVLLIFGIGSMIGNLLGGKWSDRRLLPTLFGGMALLAVSMAFFSITSHNKAAAIVTVFVWGMAAYSIITPLNIRVLQKAGHAQELASTLNISAFNLGNALGAYIGGLVIDSTLGLPAVPWAASLVTVAGIALTAWSVHLDRRVAGCTEIGSAGMGRCEA